MYLSWASLRGVNALSHYGSSEKSELCISAWFSERSKELYLSVTSLREVKAVSNHGFSLRSEGLYLRMVFLRGMKGGISAWFL